MPSDLQIFILAALAILDIAFTNGILKLGGSELFAPMRWAQATLDGGWGVLKYGATVWAAIAWAESPMLLWLAIAVMVFVTGRNWHILQRMRRA